MFIVGGIIGCIPFGIWVEKKQSYKAAVIVICGSACTFCLLEYFFFGKKIVILSYFLCFF
jgi:hypothetical protein